MNNEAELALLRQLVSEAYAVMERRAGKHRFKVSRTRSANWIDFHRRQAAMFEKWVARAASYRPVAMSPREVA